MGLQSLDGLDQDDLSLPDGAPDPDEAPKDRFPGSAGADPSSFRTGWRPRGSTWGVADAAGGPGQGAVCADLLVLRARRGKP